MDMTDRARAALITLSAQLTHAAANFFPLLDGEGGQDLREALDDLRTDVVVIAKRANDMAGTGKEASR